MSKTIHLSTLSITITTNMYITILQENLYKALSFVGKTISGKPQLPILNNVLLKTEEGRLCVSTTNLETTTTIYSGAKIDTEGSITVAARPFTEFIASLPSEKITLSLKDNILVATCGRFTADFVTTPASEFPPLPEKKDAAKCSFESDLFNDAVSFVALAASTDESRPILTGIKLEQKDDELIFAATDGFRLSVITKKTTTSLDKNIIIPAKFYFPWSYDKKRYHHDNGAYNSAQDQTPKTKSCESQKYREAII